VRPPSHAVTDRSKRGLEGTLPITTVRVRRCAGKRRQHSPQVSAPRPQAERPRGFGVLLSEGKVLGARPDHNRSCKSPHAHAGCVKRRRLQENQVSHHRLDRGANRSGLSHLFATLDDPSTLLTQSRRPKCRDVLRHLCPLSRPACRLPRSPVPSLRRVELRRTLRTVRTALETFHVVGGVRVLLLAPALDEQLLSAAAAEGTC
jgi:hypothetical protein